MLKDTKIGEKESFRVTGTVMEGKRLGRKLGFPTVNLPRPVLDDLPPNGVHAAVIHIMSGGFSGKSYPCVLNQGAQPTVPIGFETVEAYIPDFSGDLYGAEVAVDYIMFIRPEIRFGSIEELKAQIASDTQQTLQYFSENPISK